MVFPSWHCSAAKLVRSKRVDSVKCLRVKSEGALLSLKICSGEGSSFIVFWLRTDWTDFVLIIILSLFFIILWPNEIFFPKFGRNRRDSFFFLSVASIKMLIFCLHCSSSSLRSQMKQDQIKLFLSCLTDLRNQTPAPPNLFRARQIWRVIFCQKKFRCNWHLIRPSQTTRALITWLASCLSLHS